jgi:hypothetical protein
MWVVVVFVAVPVGRRLPKETAYHSVYDVEAENSLPGRLAISGRLPHPFFDAREHAVHWCR